MRKFGLWAALAVVGTATMAVGAEPRALNVPANAGWQHAATSLILRPRIAGLPRTELHDFGEKELEVSARFRTPDGATELSVFVFRPTVASISLWFDRMQAALLAREIFANAEPAGDIMSFVPPGATRPSALRRTFAIGRWPLKSTAAAGIPLGDWMVKIRISSSQLGAVALDALLTEAINGIGWPKILREAPSAVAMSACEGALDASPRAKLRKGDMVSALIGAATGLAGAEGAKAEKHEVESLCREAGATAARGVYRPTDKRNAYILAFTDAGRTARVEPSLAALVAKTDGYTLFFNDLDRTLVYPDFDRLPTPELVMRVIDTVAPISSSTRPGEVRVSGSLK